MTSAALPRRGHRSLIGMVIAAAPSAGRLARKAAPFIREHVASVTAFGLVDYGAYGLNHFAGWIVVGVSVAVLDWLVRG
jgi:hypothetical protein